ncbi:hypothetical protein AB0L13_11260 [Saccharopolyspora shandongensis]|uniref:hypothetical protein n=1 Tax=Saccharopolyspora shandongensis TaxID=418495 RepID=UPI00342E090A
MTRTTVVRARLTLACAAIALMGMFAPTAQAMPNAAALPQAAAADPMASKDLAGASVTEGRQPATVRVKAYCDVNLLAAPGPSDVVGFARAGMLLDSPDGGTVTGAWYPGTTCGDHQDSDTWTEVFVPGTQRLAYAPSYCIM